MIKLFNLTMALVCLLLAGCHVVMFRPGDARALGWAILLAILAVGNLAIFFLLG